jgi:predicted transcriptional regulator
MATLSQPEVSYLKDNVLRYLRNNSNQAILFKLITNAIIPETVTVSVFKEYLREMEQDKVLKTTEVSGRLLLKLTGKGKKFLVEKRIDCRGPLLSTC